MKIDGFRTWSMEDIWTSIYLSVCLLSICPFQSADLQSWPRYDGVSEEGFSKGESSQVGWQVSEVSSLQFSPMVVFSPRNVGKKTRKTMKNQASVISWVYHYIIQAWQVWVFFFFFEINFPSFVSQKKIWDMGIFFHLSDRWRSLGGLGWGPWVSVKVMASLDRLSRREMGRSYVPWSRFPFPSFPLGLVENWNWDPL